MKKRENLFKQEQGFTLIELMAVLAILTMLVLIAVPAIGSITKKAEAQADDATISMIEKAGGLALLGDVAYDDPEAEQYEVATLVEEGYLDIDESHEYVEPFTYVTHVKGYEFEFEGKREPVLSSVELAEYSDIANSALWTYDTSRSNTLKTKEYIRLTPGTYTYSTTSDYATVTVHDVMEGTVVSDAIIARDTRFKKYVTFKIEKGQAAMFKLDWYEMPGSIYLSSVANGSLEKID